jgi:ankyrin repeat protein
MRHSSDLNAQDENGYSPLHHASLKNNYLAAVLLLKQSNIDLNVK